MGKDSTDEILHEIGDLGTERAGVLSSFIGDQEKYQKIISHVPPAFIVRDEDAAEKTIFMADAMGDETSAVGFAVIDDEEIACVGAEGTAVPKNPDSQKVTTETLFDTGSLAKPVTAYATIRCLAAHGITNLDTSIDQYISFDEGSTEKMSENPEFLSGSATIRELLKEFSGKGITFRELLGHSSGIKDGRSQIYQEEHTTSIEFSAEELKQAKVERSLSPKQTYQYSNAGYTVLECALEGLTKKPFPDLMQDYVFDQLDMKNSTFSQSPETLNNPARQFVQGQKEHGGLVVPHLMFPRAAGGMHTTPEDYAKFVKELMRVYSSQDDGDRLVKKMFERQKRNTEEGNPCNYGLGIGIDGDGNDLCFWHNGETNTCCAAMKIYPLRKQAGIVMANSSRLGVFTEQIIRGIGKAYQWEGYYISAKPITLSRIPEEQLAKYTGDYRMPEIMANIDVQILEGKKGLVLQLPWPEPKSDPKQIELFLDEQGKLFAPKLNLIIKRDETSKTIEFFFPNKPPPPEPLLAKRVESHEIEKTESEMIFQKEAQGLRK